MAITLLDMAADSPVGLPVLSGTHSMYVVCGIFLQN